MHLQVRELKNYFDPKQMRVVLILPFLGATIKDKIKILMTLPKKEYSRFFKSFGIKVKDKTFNSLIKYRGLIFSMCTINQLSTITHPENNLELEYIDKFNAQSKSVIDIGAHCGLHTLTLAKNPSVKKIYAFEPFAQNFTQLEKNVSLNGYEDKVECKQIAVASKEEKRQFFINPSYTGQHSLIISTDTSVEIECNSLDSLFNKSDERFTLIKCDVEGAEYLVLLGAKKFLERNKPAILLEIWEKSTSLLENNTLEVERLLRSYGYAMSRQFNTRTYLYLYGGCSVSPSARALAALVTLQTLSVPLPSLLGVLA